jgi:hypothetical protein
MKENAVVMVFPILIEGQMRHAINGESIGVHVDTLGKGVEYMKNDMVGGILEITSGLQKEIDKIGDILELHSESFTGLKK